MNAQEKLKRLDARERLLAMEADLQRAMLSTTLHRWQEHKLLTLGSTVASWGWRLLAVPKVRWLVAASVLSRLRGRRRHA